MMATDLAKSADPASASVDDPGSHRRRGATIFFAATTIAQACALARYTLLARLLGPEQLGLAATMVLTSQFFSSIADSGSDRFLIQDRDGDTAAVQRLVQLVWVGRGFSVAALLLVFSGPIGALFGTPAIAPGLAGLALSSAIFGFVHLDMRRMQRRNDFTTEGIATLAGESLGLAVTVIAALVTRNFTAIVYGLVMRSLAIAVVSHIRAKRRYSIGFSPMHAARLTGFAGPLMLNGLLMFLAQQGDRVIVGSKLGLTQLGYYSAVLLLVFYPSAVLMNYLMAIHLPRIAAGRDGGEKFKAAASALEGQSLLLGILTAAGFAVVGPFAVTTLYGSRYAQSALVVCLIGVLQASRFLRLWPTTLALGISRSHIVLAGNVVRLFGLAIALAGALAWKSLVGVVLGLTVGELAAVTVALLMINRAEARRPFSQLDGLGLFALSMLAVAAWPLVLARPVALEVSGLAALTAVLAVLIVARERTTLHQAVRAARSLLAPMLRAWA